MSWLHPPEGTEPLWEQPEVVAINRLTAHAPLVPFSDAASAISALDELPDGAPLALIEQASPWVLDLDGSWRFALADRPSSVPPDVAAVDFDEAASPLEWSDIVVPGNWTRQGWDRPHYTNVQMPFSDLPPRVPADNPTGVYRTTFEVPPTWTDRRIVLHVGGAESVLFVWLNGTPVGMSKDSRLPAEFDLTALLTEGTNHLTAVVVRWSDASFIEDQDHWWMAGIHRSVRLVCTPPVHLADVVLVGDLDPASGAGAFECRVTTTPVSKGERWRVAVDVRRDVGASPAGVHAAGETVASLEASVPVPGLRRPYFGPVAVVDAELERVDAWSTDAPALYAAVVSLIDPNGTVVESCVQRFGFNRVEFVGRELRLNGRAPLIAGVNRHDHHEQLGKTVPLETMEQDIRLLKSFNFNAVRTAHYPNDTAWYDLCDVHGILIVDEANTESHAFQTSLCRDPRYAAAIMDRGQRMVLRDRNHVSIIGWSLGNESGHGPPHDALHSWMTQTDPSRFVQYEGSIFESLAASIAAGTPRDDYGLEDAHTPTDVICPMYASVEQITGWAESTQDQRPLILCEYSHAMGNSNGGLADYFHAFRTVEGLQGGFIWDWVDQGLVEEDENGRSWWAYGGDYGDEPHDANFNINGMVNPDRNPHPAMWEHKHLAQPVTVRASEDHPIEDGVVLIGNRSELPDLSWLTARWLVRVNGEVSTGGVFALPEIPTDTEQLVTLGVDLESIGTDLPGAERLVEITFELAEDRWWAAAGHEVAWGQIELAAVPASAMPERVADAGNGDQSDNGATVDLAEPALILESPRLNLWRAPIDNDGVKAFVGMVDVDPFHEIDRKPLGAWLSAGLDQGSDAGVTFDEQQRAIPNGRVYEWDIVVPDSLPDLPRVGVAFTLDGAFDEIEWFGRGPHETYDDRKVGARLGRWRQSIDEQAFPYVVPQETGNHTDTRWFALRSSSMNRGLLVIPDRPIECSALPYRVEDLYEARHVNELDPTGRVHVTIDLAQRGLGTLACGPDIHPRHRVDVGAYRLSAALLTFEPDEDPGQLYARNRPFHHGP